MSLRIFFAAFTFLTTNADTQQKALESLYAWHRDWSETARAVIRRRDHLILMGLAKRRSHKDKENNTDETNSTDPVPSPSGHTPTENTVATSAAATNNGTLPAAQSGTTAAQ